MFFDDKKKGADAVLMMKKPAAGPAAPDEPKDDGADPLEAISSELMEAIAAKDVKGVMHALHAFMLEASMG